MDSGLVKDRRLKSFFFAGIILFLLGAKAFAVDVGRWISPGELSRHHEQFEGISNCVKCHVLGKGISDEKCLDCHSTLKRLINNNSGYHATLSQPCIECHSDHKGKDHDILSLNKDDFSHDKTGYPLQGKHVGVTCESCHKKKGTFLGASRKCIWCHTDEHNGQLNSHCSRCHTVNSWQEIVNFNHDKDSRYLLTGKHRLVECKDCHIKKIFAPISYSSCSSNICHTKDIHNSQFSKDSCQRCHTTKGWVPSTYKHTPSYNTYRLKGKHNEVACKQCHARGKYTMLPHKRCNTQTCHSTDVHKGQFSKKKCKDCHTESGWKLSTFKHGNPLFVNYMLTGKHLTISCQKCHVDGVYKPVPYTNCLSSTCHIEDPHDGQFRKTECSACHTEEGWKPSTFEHSNPDYSGFKLEGKHAAVECAQCHKEGKYVNISYTRCDGGRCHTQGIHNGQFNEDDCSRCHTAKEWKSSTFTHKNLSYAGFRLEGKHAAVECAQCHKEGKYVNISYTRCDGGRCHAQDIHNGQFNEDDCSRCHTVKGWKPSTFTHGSPGYAGFPLKGKHKTTKCMSCHKNGKYVIEKECAACHETVYHRTVTKKCERCHSQKKWTVKKFDHNKIVGFSLDKTHLSISCHRCHQKDNKENRLISVCSERCHSDDHEGQFGKSCGSCHFLVNWKEKNFNHSQFNFILAGPHAYADCKDCHTKKNYKDVSKDCYSCHTKEYLSYDHEKKKFGKNCLSCHSLHNWSFKHLAPSADCLSCHENDTPGKSHKGSFQQFSCGNCHDYQVENWNFIHLSVSPIPQCVFCHKKEAPRTHSTDEFGSYCEGCHSWESQWKKNFFNVKKFPDVSYVHSSFSVKNCTLCHPRKFIADDGRCITCHAKGKECARCHAKENLQTAHEDNKKQPCTFCHLMGLTP